MKLSIHPLTDPIPAVAGGAKIDQQLIYRLRVSLTQLLEKGDELSQIFYGLLFERHPQLRALFPNDMTAQRRKLADTLAWIVTYLDSHEQVLTGIRDLGKRHVTYGARPEHYPFIRDSLVEAMAKVGGKDWTQDLTDDWRMSIDLIARHMMAAAEDVEHLAASASSPASSPAAVPTTNPATTSTTPR